MAMGAGRGDDGMGMMMPPTDTNMEHDMGDGTVMHMTFFWGKHAQVLFAGWPGDRGLGMYFLSLVFVAAVAAIAETLSSISGSRRGVSGGALAVVHGIQMGLAYMVMLAVMSFNGGVFIAAVVGHALGFLLSRSFRSSASDEEANNRSTSKN
ncbi:copper transporter 6-like [Typha latifolia]|uniref:copper transporter 6-like n=1 Tax=Typha latifolia TaxID=4733 RepID=UPI003C2BBAF2